MLSFFPESTGLSSKSMGGRGAFLSFGCIFIKVVMPTIFLTSDTHFGHWGVCKFLRSDGTKLRPWNTPEEMDEALVANWNAVVKPTDKVYH